MVLREGWIRFFGVVLDVFLMCLFGVLVFRPYFFGLVSYGVVLGFLFLEVFLVFVGFLAAPFVVKRLGGVFRGLGLLGVMFVFGLGFLGYLVGSGFVGGGLVLLVFYFVLAVLVRYFDLAGSGFHFHFAVTDLGVSVVGFFVAVVLGLPLTFLACSVGEGLVFSADIVVYSFDGGFSGSPLASCYLYSVLFCYFGFRGLVGFFHWDLALERFEEALSVKGGGQFRGRYRLGDV